MSRLTFVLPFLFSVVLVAGINGEVCYSDYCEFHMTISFGETMARTEDGESEDALMVTGDCLHGASVEPTSSNCHRVAETKTLEESRAYFNKSGEQLVTADGQRRKVIFVNGQFPGPTLEVGHNSQVVVHVKNELGTVGTSIHWHGMTMKDTPWMDGVAFITQCPILPHQTFTYNFKATPAGTHWYHSHHGKQRRDGLYGLFIVHEQMPKMPAFPLIVQDWFHAESFTEKSTDLRTLREGDEPEPISSLINGRNGMSTDPTQLGLKNAVTTFRVKKGDEYKFHTLNPGGDFPYEIHIDDHEMVVVALDGIPIVPVTVRSFIINAGERIDFILKADQLVGRYWLHAIPVEVPYKEMGVGHGSSEEVGEEEENMDAFRVDAIILYDDVEYGMPNTIYECTKDKPCVVLNCPFPQPPDTYKQCIPVSDVRSRKPLGNGLGKGAQITERFLNVGDNWHDSINARRHIQPFAPFYPPSKNNGVVDCHERCSDVGKGCECTHIINLPYDEVIQIVLTNFEPPSTGLHPGHPMHIHGHHFAVVAQGFPVFNHSSNTKIADNPDIKCDSPLCRNMFWAQEPKKINLIDPPMKDTVIVPPGGYVVLRFRSDNPGFWFVHCHILFDMVEGMALILKVAPHMTPPAPEGFPTCSPFQRDIMSIKKMAGNLELMTGDGNNGMMGDQGQTKDGNKYMDDSEMSIEESTEDESSDDSTQEASSEEYESPGQEEKSQDNDESKAANKAKARLDMSLPELIGIVLGSVALGAVLVGVPLLCYVWCVARKKNGIQDDGKTRF